MYELFLPNPQDILRALISTISAQFKTKIKARKTGPKINARKFFFSKCLIFQIAL